MQTSYTNKIIIKNYKSNRSVIFGLEIIHSRGTNDRDV